MPCLSTAPENYVGNFPFFRKPVEYGCFSHDTSGNLTFDSKSRKVLKLPSKSSQVHFDLRKNYETFIQKDDSKSLDDLLQWLQRNKAKFRATAQGQEDTEFRQTDLNTDFICWRGILTKIASTPYERIAEYGSWKIAVIKYGGTHYMCEYDTESKVKAEQRRTARMKEMCYWGFKFEQYLCVDNVDDEPNTSVPVNNKQNYASIVRSRLKQHSLVYGGEVDCYRLIQGKKEYIELKTTKEIGSHREECSFRRNKLRKWWLQSFLIGIPTIVCGFRDDDGVVHRLHTYSTARLPEMASGLPDSWDSCVCFNFLDSFLQFVKETVTKDNPRIPYVFEWEPGRNVTVTEMEESPKYCFLPQWYYEQTSPVFGS